MSVPIELKENGEPFAFYRKMGGHMSFKEQNQGAISCLKKNQKNKGAIWFLMEIRGPFAFYQVFWNRYFRSLLMKSFMEYLIWKFFYLLAKCRASPGFFLASVGKA